MNVLKRIGILALLLLGSCGYVNYDKAPAGRFSGSLFVMWVGEGGPLGDGKFVFVPDPNNPLTFVRDASRPARTIRPEMMYTDGGSIPKIGQVFKGFAPWGYAPAYMIHDWLFLARHCNLDGDPTAEEAKVADMAFQESAEIIAEAIKTLIESGRVRENDTAPFVISSTVAGPVSRAIWDREGACPDPRVSEEDRLAAEAAIPGSSVRLQGLTRDLPGGQEVPLRRASLIGAFTF